MKKVKRLFSLVLLCATVFGMLHVDAHAPKVPPTVEEELRLAKKVQELLREVGAVSYTHLLLTSESCLHVVAAAILGKSKSLW